MFGQYFFFPLFYIRRCVGTGERSSFPRYIDDDDDDDGDASFRRHRPDVVHITCPRTPFFRRVLFFCVRESRRGRVRATVTTSARRVAPGGMRMGRVFVFFHPPSPTTATSSGKYGYAGPTRHGLVTLSTLVGDGVNGQRYSPSPLT